MRFLLVLAIVVLVLFSCKEKPHPQLQLQSEEGTEKADSVASEVVLSNAPFEVILQQLHLEKDKFYDRFVSKARVVGHNDLTIWVIPEITYLEKDDYGNEAFNLASHIVVADTETGQIKSKHYNADGWSSDAYELIDIGIDTIVSKLSNDRIVFGVFSAYRASTRVSPTGNSGMTLFVQQGDSLLPIFSYSMNSYHGENDGGLNGNGYMNEETTEFWVADRKTNGLFDFALIETTRSQTSENHETIESNFDYKLAQVFRYNGTKYEEDKNSHQVVCKEKTEGIGGGYTCYYFGKTLAEVYRIVYNKNEDDTQRYLLPELPTEKETQYKKNFGDDYGELLIDYTYTNSKELSISIEFEMGVLYYDLIEKDGYTILIYSYHD